MRFFIALFLLLTGVDSFGSFLTRNPIYHSLKVLNNKIDHEKAVEYSNLIAKYSRKYSVDPFLLVSIARQESHIVLDTTAGHLEDEVVLLPDGSFVKYFIVSDVCMMQIHRSNVSALNLDPNRLLNDADYCIHEGVKILKNFKYLANTDARWWSRYNASKVERRAEYEKFILRHYNKILDKVPNIYVTINRYNATPTVEKVIAPGAPPKVSK